jgi:hypothetical protein
MKDLRETLIKNILSAKSEDEIECLVLGAINILRKHLVNEFVIAQFIDKLICELRAKGFDNDFTLIKIRLLHPTGLQWQFG